MEAFGMDLTRLMRMALSSMEADCPATLLHPEPIEDAWKVAAVGAPHEPLLAETSSQVRHFHDLLRMRGAASPDTAKQPFHSRIAQTVRALP
jgi:hypothetical protein